MSEEVTKAPAWARDYIEGLESEQRRREEKELEENFPGITAEFEELAYSIPSQDSSRLVEFPVIAGVLQPYIEADGKKKYMLISRALNIVNQKKNSTLHAEMVVLQDAMEKVGDKHLRECVLITTCEPCAMCAGAAINTEVKGVVFGISQADMRGKHVLIEGEYKPHRAAPEGYSAAGLIKPHNPDIFVYGGLHREIVQRRMTRISGTWKAYYNDPDK